MSEEKKPANEASHPPQQYVAVEMMSIAEYLDKLGAVKYRVLEKKPRADEGDTPHIATGTLGENHGLAGSVRSDGHFDFFEEEGIDFTKVFVIDGDLRNA